MYNKDFEEKISFLNTTLRDSIERLLQEAKNKNAVLPPFGRPPTPTPFIDDDEEISPEPDSADEDTRDDPSNFKYEYGFNPLIFLADFIHRAHPKSIALRKEHQANARARLKFRAAHAKKQLDTGAALVKRAAQLRSGIIHGPLTYPRSPKSVTFFCRTVVAGNVVVEVSRDPDFSSITVSSVFSSAGPSQPLKEELAGLEVGARYFLRCRLQLQGEETAPEQQQQQQQQQPGVVREDVCFAQCQFWTLLDVVTTNAEGSFQEVEILAINGRARPPQGRAGQELARGGGSKCCLEVEADLGRPLFSVLVGDIFDNEDKTDSSSSPEIIDAQLWHMFRNDPVFAPYSPGRACNSLLSSSSMLCAWNDSQRGSDTGLKAEEIVHKQWSYDTRKYEKRQKEKADKEKKEASEQRAAGAGAGAGAVTTGPTHTHAPSPPNANRKRSLAAPPVLSRPAMSLAFRKLAKEMPLQYSEDNVRHWYRSFLLSPDVEVFVLDSRNGYLGKDQVRWLKDGIRKSSAAMKVVFSGKSFGLQLVDSKGAAARLEEEEVAAAAVAAARELEELEERQTTDSSNSNQEEETDAATGGVAQQGKQAAVTAAAAKKVSSSRQRALEATKEEFDEDGLSKSTLAHVLVSTHRKLYPPSPPENQDLENDQEGNQELDQRSPPPQEQEQEDSGTAASSKIVLSGGILIVSSADSEESFAASYNFSKEGEGREEKHVGGGEGRFCLELGLGRSCKEGASGPQKCQEQVARSSADALVARGRRVLYRSSSSSSGDGNSLGNDHNLQALACSIVVKERGVLDVTLRRVDTGTVEFQAEVHSALSH